MLIRLNRFTGFNQRLFLSAVSDGGGSAPSGQPEHKAPSPESETTDGGVDPGVNAQSASEGGETQSGDPVKDTEGQTKEALDNAIKTAVDNAMKKASMTDEERVKYEFDEKERILDEREKAITVRELKANTVRLLAETGLSADIADVVMGKDMKDTAQNVKKFKGCLDAEVQKQVAERLKGKTPAAGNAQTGEENSVKAQFLRGLNSV